MAKMHNLSMDPDTLAAFVDGELSPEDAAHVLMHLEAHPADKAFVEEIERSNALLAKAFDAPLYEPVPEAILATIQDHEPVQDNVVPFMRRTVPTPVLGGLLAASVAIVLGVGMWTGQDRGQLNVGQLASASQLSDVLDTLPTGTVTELSDMEVEATVLSSFLDNQDRVCREFEIAGEARVERGIACREDDAWRVAGRITVPEAEIGEEGAFVPAGGEADGTLDALLDELGAGMMLTHQEEEALMARGWRN